MEIINLRRANFEGGIAIFDVYYRVLDLTLKDNILRKTKDGKREFVALKSHHYEKDGEKKYSSDHFFGKEGTVLFQAQAKALVYEGLKSLDQQPIEPQKQYAQQASATTGFGNSPKMEDFPDDMPF